MALFNRIGDISKKKNQTKLFTLLMKMGINKPNEMTGVCVTVITSLALMHEMPKETFQMMLDDILEKFDEMQKDPEAKEILERTLRIHEKMSVGDEK